MSMGIELLIISIIFLIFSNGGVYSLIYALTSVSVSFIYYLFFIKEYRRLDDDQKKKCKTQIDARLIIILMMIITINLVKSLGVLNLIFASVMLVYVVISMIIKIIKKNIISNPNFINYGYMFDIYCALSLFSLFWEVINYAI